MEPMRVLAAIGTIGFLYLAVIPAGLVYSTLDSACAGQGCETSTASKVALTAIYGACLVAVLGTAALFAAHAASGSHRSQERLVRGLTVSAKVIGLALLALFTIAFPLGAAIALAAAGGGFAVVHRLADRARRRIPGPGANGPGSLNGRSLDGGAGGERLPRPPTV